MYNIETRFLENVAKHTMTVTADHGVVRHLHFETPGHSTNSFSITTWPGHLAISGDADCYVFSRLHDMFEFFRGGQINPDYWAEKLQAASVHSKLQEFSNEAFVDAVASDMMNNWSFTSVEQSAAATAAVTSSGMLNKYFPGSAEEAVDSAEDYVCSVTGQKFTDFEQHDLTDWSYRYLWSCHAIQWAIRRYDAGNDGPVGACFMAPEDA